jgi:hypothetical protein
VIALLRFWPHALALVALGCAILWFSHVRFSAGYEAAQATMAEAVRKAEAATRAAEIESRKRAEAVDRDYQNRLQDLDAKYRDASERLGSIRVRKCPAGGVSLSRDSPAAAVDHDPAGADGVPRDVSPDIERLLKQADDQAQRLIACQQYASSIVQAR